MVSLADLIKEVQAEVPAIVTDPPPPPILGKIAADDKTSTNLEDIWTSVVNDNVAVVQIPAIDYAENSYDFDQLHHYEAILELPVSTIEGGANKPKWDDLSTQEKYNVVRVYEVSHVSHLG